MGHLLIAIIPIVTWPVKWLENKHMACNPPKKNEGINKIVGSYLLHLYLQVMPMVWLSRSLIRMKLIVVREKSVK